MLNSLRMKNALDKVQIGDYVSSCGIFTKPGVIIEKKDDGTLVIDTDPTVISEYKKYGDVTGLPPEQKAQFNDILDNVYSQDNAGEQVNLLETKINELRLDPTKADLVINLRGEQSKLIRESKALPRVYSVDYERVVGSRADFDIK